MASLACMLRFLPWPVSRRRDHRTGISTPTVGAQMSLTKHSNLHSVCTLVCACVCARGCVYECTCACVCMCGLLVQGLGCIQPLRTLRQKHLLRLLALTRKFRWVIERSRNLRFHSCGNLSSSLKPQAHWAQSLLQVPYIGQTRHKECAGCLFISWTTRSKPAKARPTLAPQSSCRACET